MSETITITVVEIVTSVYTDRQSLSGSSSEGLSRESRGWETRQTSTVTRRLSVSDLGFVVDPRDYLCLPKFTVGKPVTGRFYRSRPS